MVSIGKKIVRYQQKNTIAGQYKRHINRAQLGGLAASCEILKIPYSFDIADVGITSFCGAFALDNLRKALKNLKDLKPIIARAEQIKKYAKLAKK